jgi:MoaA/NifB/PqqE/SkfB family radical SAM enzyme
MQTVVRTDGGMGVCCNIQSNVNVRTTNIYDFWNSDYINNFQQNILEGNKIKECENCYKSEELSGSSMRTETLADYKFFSEKTYIKLMDYYGYTNRKFPARVELHCGNLCNLKCLTCNPADSSAFLSEDKVLKITNYDQRNFSIDDDLIKNNINLCMEHEVDLLDLRGGESMLVPKVKRTLLDLPEHLCRNKTIRVQTNGTILDDAWKTIFQKFKVIEIMLSIDAYDIANTYIRYPADWSKIETSLEYFKSLSNCKLYINCTVSNLNFIILSDLLSWADRKNIYIHTSILTSPGCYKYTNMPSLLYEEAKNKLLPWLSKPQYSNLEKVIAAEPDDTKWEEFCKIITVRDRYRGNNIFDIIPQFKEYWQCQDKITKVI